MASYGIPWMGSKSRIIKHLGLVFPSADNFYEIWCRDNTSIINSTGSKKSTEKLYCNKAGLDAYQRIKT